MRLPCYSYDTLTSFSIDKIHSIEGNRILIGNHKILIGQTNKKVGVKSFWIKFYEPKFNINNLYTLNHS